MSRVGIAASSEAAADAGAAIADGGGNAVDAAVAAALVSMCTDIGVIAPGAGGFLTIWPGDGEDPVVIDAYAEMPGRGLGPDRFGRGGRKVWMDYGGGMSTIVGPGSVAVPGAMAGFGLAIERYGRAPWPEVLQPAIEVVRSGFTVSGASVEYLAYAHDAIFGWQRESSAVVHRPEGAPIGAADIVYMPDLVGTLEALAEEGPRLLYEGELGKKITDAIQSGEGLLTMDDLVAYRPIVREPVQVGIDGWTVASNPPPAVGGACLGALMLLLDDGSRSGWDSGELETLARAQRAVLDYRRRHLDPNDADRAAEAAELLDAASLKDLGRILSSPSTVHTSTVDGEGTGCSVTVSAGYGSGIMAPGTGFWLNNSLGEVELHPEGFHAVPTGTRLVSNMAPTVVRSDEGSVLSIGSPGADRITTAISSVLLNFIHLGMSLSDAVAHPRLHAEVFDGESTVAFEPGLDVEPFDDLKVRRFPDLSMYFGGVQAALWDPAAGHFEAADPRRAGGTARGGSETA